MSKRCTDIALEYFNGRRKLIGSIREEIMEKVVSQRNVYNWVCIYERQGYI